MSENAGDVGPPLIPRTVMMEFMFKRLQHQPDSDRNLWNYGPFVLAGSGAFGGLLANSLYRKALNVTQFGITSSIALAAFPFFTTTVFYYRFVTLPLMSGELDCPTCCLTRGALVGAINGGLYPVLFALSLNASTAFGSKSALVPEGLENIVRFYANLSRPILRKMAVVTLIQAALGIYLSNRQFEIYLQLRRPPPSKDEELIG